MNRIIIIDSQIAGISGDMLLSCMVDCGADKNKIIKNIIKIQEYFGDTKIKKVDFIRTESNGIGATRFVLDFDEITHEKNATEMYRIISNCCNNISLSERAKRFVIGSIKTMIYAESSIHNKEIKDLHLHESASIDTGADLIGCATALDDLDLLNDSTTFYTTQVAVGGGVTEFSHGMIPNPTNAILEIFKNFDISIKGGPVDTELTTPTGASMLVNLNPRKIVHYPGIIPEKIGYGTGTKTFNRIPNILRITIGKPDFFKNIKTDKATILETNIDDINGEMVGDLIDKLSNKDPKVKDVTIINGITKKNRPTYILKVICSEEIEKKIAEIIFQHTGTLGIRKYTVDRYILERFNLVVPIEIEDESFVINVKIAKNSAGKIVNIKPEYEDLKKISDKLDYSLKKTTELVNNLIFQRNLYDI